MGFDYGSYFEGSLDSGRASGNEIVGDCPFCGKEGKLWVNGTTGRWICFRCEEGGRAAGLIAELEGITRSEAEARIFRDSLAARAGDPEMLIDKFRASLAADDDEDVDEPLPDEFKSIWDAEAKRWKMPVYLVDRGVTREAAAHFGMGFCDSGRYGGRVIVPVVCPRGSAWVARATGDQEPKYLNPSRAALGRLVMGWDDLVGGDFVIVEGAFDVIRLWQHGIKAVATLGKVLHSEQMGLLRCMPREAAPTVMLDPEEKIAPFNMASMLKLHFRRVYVASLPVGVDPGSSTAAQANAAVDGAYLASAGPASIQRARL